MKKTLILTGLCTVLSFVVKSQNTGQKQATPVATTELQSVKTTTEVEPKNKVVFSEKPEKVKPAGEATGQKTVTNTQQFSAEPSRIPPAEKTEEKDKKDSPK